jgi:hypothetical protein
MECSKTSAVGDGDIEGKLKKIVARANELKERKPLSAVNPKPAEGSNECGRRMVPQFD